MSEPEPPWQSTQTSAPEFWAPEPDFDAEEKPPLDLWGVVGKERPWATVLLVFAWCVAYAAMGRSVGNVSAELRWGGFPTPAFAAPVPWRWLAYTAVHGSTAHLASNAFVMLVLGSAVERIFTRTHFLLLFALGGVAGAAGTLLWETVRHPGEPSVSVGASGAIFALGAALLVASWRLRHQLATSRARALAASILWLVVPGLFVGFQMPHVGSAAHVGGFVAGAALGFGLGMDPRLEERAPNALTRLAGAASAFALAICYTIGFYSGIR